MITDGADRRRAMEELAALSDVLRQYDETTVCPEHLRFVPCRQCPVGEEKYSTDARDVERTVRFQHGDDEADRYRRDHSEHFRSD